MLDLSIIYDRDITVRSLNVYANPIPIVPPDAYECTAGMRMFSRFFYVTGGELVFNTGTENELCACAGDIVYLPHDVTYVSRWRKGCVGSFLTVNFIINDPGVVFSDGICIAVHDADGSYLKIFRRLLDVRTKGAFDSHLRALAVFMELLSALSDDISKSAVKSSFGAVSDGIMYIESHFWEDFSVNDLAKMCAVSPATFRRQFKSYSSYSPITYRNFLRVRRAAELLENGEYNVTEAALAVGFDDLSYFNRTFKKFLSTTPSDIIPPKAPQ